MLNLRPIQKEVVYKAWIHITSCLDSCVLSLVTSFGKSYVLAELAHRINKASGKKVLVLAPTAEICIQNHEKYLLTGEPASLFSASAGKKCMIHDVIFGSPLTVNNSIDKFKNFGAVFVDESHISGKAIHNIISKLRDDNPRLRVLGCTGTPYRLKTGYIYEIDEEDKIVEQSIDPFYKKLICDIKAPEMIEAGWLIPPTTCNVLAGSYDTKNLEVDRKGDFTKESLDRAFTGKGRLTSQIISEVVEMSKNRNCVMIFAATRQHAKEIMDSLPKELSALVTGDTAKGDRKEIIEKTRNGIIKYLVSVGALTTGVDIPIVDTLAILRATESASLFQQIIGRSLRLHPDSNKTDALILDYADNISAHGLEDDLFNPEIKASFGKKESNPLQITCPDCGFSNEFGRRNDAAYDGLLSDDYGYFIDLAGNRIVTDMGEIPSHYGRRCMGASIEDGHYSQCDYRWTSKECPECSEPNDIAARYCSSCKCEIIDPNEKLRLEFKRIKTDPYTVSTDKILAWKPQGWHAQSGNYTLKVDYTTEYRSFSIWYQCDTNNTRQLGLWSSLSQSVFGEGRVAPSVDAFIAAIKKGSGKMPESITVKRDKGSKFYLAFAHNKKIDKEPS